MKIRFREDIHIFIACGHTNIRKSVDGFVPVQKNREITSHQFRCLVEGLSIDQKKVIQNIYMEVCDIIAETLSNQ